MSIALKCVAVLFTVGFLAGCATDSAMEQKPPRGAELISGPASGDEVIMKIPVTEIKVPFPLWNGKQWKKQVYYDGGSWPMDVSVRLSKVEHNGQPIQVAVISAHEHGHGRWGDRRHECWYSSQHQKLIKCDINKK